MLCWMTGTGIVTVAGVGAGVAVGVAVGVAAAVGVAVALGAAEVPPCPPADGDERKPALTSLMISAPMLRLTAAPARATPPATRNCRLVATTDRMQIILYAQTFRNDDALRHGIARCAGRRWVHINQTSEVNVKWSPINTSTTSLNRQRPPPNPPPTGGGKGKTQKAKATRRGKGKKTRGGAAIKKKKKKKREA